MLAEVNDDVSAGSIRGRILKHVLSEVLQDIIPHFNWNSNTRRFVRKPATLDLSNVPECERDAPPKGVNEHRWYGVGIILHFVIIIHVLVLYILYTFVLRAPFARR